MCMHEDIDRKIFNVMVPRIVAVSGQSMANKTHKRHEEEEKSVIVYS